VLGVVRDGVVGFVGAGDVGVVAAAAGLAGLELTAVASEPPPPQAGKKSTFMERISERLDDFIGRSSVEEPDSRTVIRGFRE
jgi:hypothetical protein